MVNFRQLSPIQQNPKFHEEQDWQMNQQAYPDVKNLNINDRECVTNMHTQTTHKPVLIKTTPIHQNPQIPNMKT